MNATHLLAIASAGVSVAIAAARLYAAIRGTATPDPTPQTPPDTPREPT